MRKMLFNQNVIKNWQIFIVLLVINELLLLLVWEALEPGLVIGGSIYRPERYFHLNTIKNYFQSMYYYVLVLLPLLIGIKYFLLSLFLQMPFIVQFKDLAFNKALRIVLVASSSQILAGFARYIVFMQKDLGAEKVGIQERIPLGILSLIETEPLHQATVFLLNQFNLFEFIWCVLVYNGLIYYKADHHSKLRMLVPFIWLTLIFFQFLFILVSSQFIEI